MTGVSCPTRPNVVILATVLRVLPMAEKVLLAREARVNPPSGCEVGEEEEG